MTDASASLPPPRALPWPLVGIFLGVGAIVLGPTLLVSPHAMVATMAGLVPGLFGSFISSKQAQAAPVIATGAAFLCLLFNPPILVFAGLCLALVLLAGYEAAITGGRGYVMGLYGVLFLQLNPVTDPMPQAVPFALAGLIAGWGAARIVGITGKAAQPPHGTRFGIGLAVFLMLGLAATAYVMRHVDHPHSFWFTTLLVFRAVAPRAQTVRSALKFGTGAMIGGALVLLILPLGLPDPLLKIAATGLFVFGLRYLPHPNPWSPTCMTMAILLAFAPKVSETVFRMEASVMVVLVVTVLAYGIAGMWYLTGRFSQTR